MRADVERRDPDVARRETPGHRRVRHGAREDNALEPGGRLAHTRTFRSVSDEHRADVVASAASERSKGGRQVHGPVPAAERPREDRDGAARRANGISPAAPG